MNKCTVPNKPAQVRFFDKINKRTCAFIRNSKVISKHLKSDVIFYYQFPKDCPCPVNDENLGKTNSFILIEINLCDMKLNIF